MRCISESRATNLNFAAITLAQCDAHHDENSALFAFSTIFAAFAPVRSFVHKTFMLRCYSAFFSKISFVIFHSSRTTLGTTSGETRVVRKRRRRFLPIVR